MNVGVYIDSSNIAMNGGFGLRYDQLRHWACRDGGQAMRLNIYLALDLQRCEADSVYDEKMRGYMGAARQYGYKVVVKPVKRYRGEDGIEVVKSNADLDMAVDVLMQSDKLDYVLLLTGDGDFVRLVSALQDRGSRVEVMAFQNYSRDLGEAADVFTNGYLVPHLLPAPASAKGSTDAAQWGSIGSRVCGRLLTWNTDKGYGFFQYMPSIQSGTWEQQRSGGTAWVSVFCHYSDLGFNPSCLPNRDMVFEFEITPPESAGKAQRAKNVTVTYAPKGVHIQPAALQPGRHHDERTKPSP
ncbi:NYN domain-containing protein [Alcanivorax sp. 1008]|uniref:LabA-like NYN domain-containing protein n=1 Tax=Alcanivorax sp. 1008 TaxID=2816853 RepID=UPI001D59EBB0|nr:NYN domain-containing protein [Alcanivorax sp. 1008]MCC1496827.1 NYN domain-containing protein [Alcanivorax sp. 1008]